MALSNIFREPRREITESVVGLALAAAILVPLLWVDYHFARWFEEITGGAGNGGCPWQLGMGLFGPMAGLGIMAALFATHELGDRACDALERRGLQLRPRR